MKSVPVNKVLNTNINSKILFSICLVFSIIFTIFIMCSCSTAGATLSTAVDATEASAKVNSVNGKELKIMIAPSMGNNMMGGGSGMDDMGKPPSDSASPNGENFGSNPPAKPDGDSSSSTPPAKPDSNNNTSQNGSGSSNNGNSGASGNTGGNGQGGNGLGGTPGGNGSGGNAPGENNMGGNGGTPPDMMLDQDQNGNTTTLIITNEDIIKKSDGSKGSISDISSGSNLELKINNGTNVEEIKIVEMGAMGNMENGQNSGNVNNGTSSTTINSDKSESNSNFSSDKTDDNALRAENSATATLNNCSFEKTGDTSSNEDSDFYGLNAIAYVWDKAKMIINGGSLTSDSKGSNALFVYGSESSAEISDAKIKTTKDNSGGIEVSGGGSIIANNLDVETQGGSSAAVRSDRGGGTETVNGGTYKAHGQGSPAIYCTADVSVSNAYLESETSEVNVIEGKNSIKLDNCSLNCNTQGKQHRGDNIRNIMLYQSMSGDADQGTCNYSAKNSKFQANFGNIFYVTNTSAIINLENCDFSGTYDAFMKIAGNSENWGQSGKNGGNVECNCANQKITGDVSVDSISKLDLKLSNNTSYTGSINKDGNNGEVNLTLDNSSKFLLNADTYVSSLNGDTSGIDLCGHKLYVNGVEWQK